MRTKEKIMKTIKIIYYTKMYSKYNIYINKRVELKPVKSSVTGHMV